MEKKLNEEVVNVGPFMPLLRRSVQHDSSSLAGNGLKIFVAGAQAVMFALGINNLYRKWEQPAALTGSYEGVREDRDEVIASYKTLVNDVCLTNNFFRRRHAEYDMNSNAFA